MVLCLSKKSLSILHIRVHSFMGMFLKAFRMAANQTHAIKKNAVRIAMFGKLNKASLNVFNPGNMFLFNAFLYSKT